jgi:hypothetical protein
MPSLRELQAEFMSAVLDDDTPPLAARLVSGGRDARRRIAVYRQNAEANFLHSLRLCFPAVQRLVGEEYFLRCVRRYRTRRPSGSGDLQHAGAAFPGYLAEVHGQDEFRYLSDVARLEWLVHEAETAAAHGRFDFGRLARVPPSQHAGLRFRLSPSARLFAAPYPVLDIWEANVRCAAEPEPIDLAGGTDRLLLVRPRHGRIGFHRLSAAESGFLHQLQAAADLGTAMTAAAAHDAEFDAGAALRRFVAADAIVDFSVVDFSASDA